MINKRISVRYGQTCNMGDYENVRVDAEFAADLEPHEDIDTAYTEAWKTVTSTVRQKLRRTRKKLLLMD